MDINTIRRAAAKALTPKAKQDEQEVQARTGTAPAATPAADPAATGQEDDVTGQDALSTWARHSREGLRHHLQRAMEARKALPQEGEQQFIDLSQVLEV